ncbi:N-acetyltransferase [Microbacterium sp. 18062]|uniref:GNAT family N-acetyltransferase n=1 Tax=Microbacterium sp. 18062 TaxID=2681410 RepID=UPI00190F18FC|nr:GNAT family N-acetyltransferase [Microbacterium sp. 18062]
MSDELWRDDGIRVRAASSEDAAAMAHVHVASWREAYRRTLVPDEVLDAPDFVERRERFWSSALTDPRWAASRVAVAEHRGTVIGIAMSEPVDGLPWTRHLDVLYVLAAHHGTGVGAALLNAVIDPAEDAALWVGDPVPRAQAFYRREGFVPDGTVKIEDGIRAIRMVRLRSDDS